MSTPTETLSAHLLLVKVQLEAISLWLAAQLPHCAPTLPADERDEMIARLHVVATTGEEISIAARRLAAPYLSKKSHDQNA